VNKTNGGTEVKNFNVLQKAENVVATVLFPTPPYLAFSLLSIDVFGNRTERRTSPASNEQQWLLAQPEGVPEKVRE
jgi:hypothetical protein